MSTVKVRPFEWQKDLKPILHIVQDVWFFDAPSKSIGYLNAMNFMLHYLNLSTDIIVVVDTEDNERPIGILGLTDKKSAPYLSKCKLLWVKACTLEWLSKAVLYVWPNSLVSRLFNGIFFDNYAKLRKMVPKHNDPEYLVMIVDPQVKGKGLGRTLVQAGEDLLAKRGFESYYLLTDSSCDYGFYERLNMDKVVDVNMCFDIKHVPKYDHYLSGFLRGLVYSKAITKPHQP